MRHSSTWSAILDSGKWQLQIGHGIPSGTGARDRALFLVIRVSSLDDCDIAVSSAGSITVMPRAEGSGLEARVRAVRIVLRTIPKLYTSSSIILLTLMSVVEEA